MIQISYWKTIMKDPLNVINIKTDFRAADFLNTPASHNGRTYSQILGAESEQTGKALDRFVQNYDIVSKEQFDNRVGEIVNEINKLTQSNTYSIIASQPGKSNFWLAEQVLERVCTKPKAVHTMAVKEKGDLAYRISAVEQNKLIENQNHLLIFLDDAAYSGSQFSKMLGQFDKIDRNQIRIGQVASSSDAANIIKSMGFTNVNFLGTPIEIKKAAENDIPILENLARRVRPQDFGDESVKPGFYQTAMYYKIPDLASTMDYIPFYEGYKNGQEPYKQKGYLEIFYGQDILTLINATGGTGNLLPGVSVCNIEISKIAQTTYNSQLTRSNPFPNKTPFHSDTPRKASSEPLITRFPKGGNLGTPHFKAPSIRRLPNPATFYPQGSNLGIPPFSDSKDPLKRPASDSNRELKHRRINESNDVTQLR
jgi:hypothetical protein